MTPIKRRNIIRILIKIWISSSLVPDIIKKHVPLTRVRKPTSPIRVRISESRTPFIGHPFTFIIITVLICWIAQFLFVENPLNWECCRGYMGGIWCGGGWYDWQSYLLRYVSSARLSIITPERHPFDDAVPLSSSVHPYRKALQSISSPTIVRAFVKTLIPLDADGEAKKTSDTG